MKKHLLKFVALVVLGPLLLAACKKEDEGVTRSEMIVGTWRTTQAGDDVNSNGLWDNSERGEVDSLNAGLFHFNADGTGEAGSIYSQLNFSLRWNLQNNDNELRIITSFGIGNDTVVHPIITLTNTDLVFMDTTETPHYFLALKKQ